MPRLGSGALTFAVCAVFWLLLTDHRTPLSLGLGAAAALLVAWANADAGPLRAAIRVAPRLLAYLPWLLKEIAVANLQVVRVVLDPRLPIDPVVVRLPTSLASDEALATLGNSITLTPGTVTLDVDGSTLVVHALTADGARSLQAGDMVRRVARVFGEIA